MPFEKSDIEELVEKSINEQFDNFKKTFWNKIRKPAIGIIVAIAALVALSGVYVYIDASAKVYQSQAELAKAQKDFYESMRESEKEVLEIKNQMVENFNVWASDAEKNMLLLQEKLSNIEEYDKKFSEILDKHKKAFDKGPHKRPNPFEEEWSEDDFYFHRPSGQPRMLPEDTLEEVNPGYGKPEPETERPQIQLTPPPPAQKSYKIDPSQMIQQGILK